MGMTNAVSEDKWTEIKITVSTSDIETAGNIANMVVPYGIYIEDYSALEEETMQIAHIDLIEESLLKKDRTKGVIHVYVNPHENPFEATSFLTQRLDSEGIEHTIDVGDCLTEDWQNNWKQYYHAMPIGKKLLIRSLWESEYEADGRKVLNIEPGLAFGTGSHPTTKLCLETLEDYIDESSEVLDIGCGSGILSIAALLLGAKSALGVDIDALAVRTAKENGELNGLVEPKYTILKGDLARDVSGKYPVIAANIVADAIIALSPAVPALLADGGVYIVSGIIDSREQDVLTALADCGFTVVERHAHGGWLCLVCKRG